MTKEEKIQEAYGEYWELVKDKANKNGIITFSEYKILPIKFHEMMVAVDYQGLFYTPKSLIGIENNNGWTKIENEKILFEKPENCIFEWYNIFDKRYDVGEHFNYGVFTHFKVIPEPQKELPLY